MRQKLNIFIYKLKNSALAKDSLWSLVGSVAGQGLSLIAGIFVARFLGKDIYGEYGMIKTTLLNIAIFSTFGLGYTATKFIAESKNKYRQNIRQIAFGSINITLVTSITFALLLFIFAKQVAIYLNAEHLALSLRIFAVNIVFNALTTVQVGILAGFNEFKAIAKIKIIAGVITFILSVVLTYFYDIEGALAALLIATLVNCVLNNIVVRKQLKLYPQPIENKKNIIKQLLTFSLPITLQEGVYSITSWLGIFLLVKLSNYGEVGLYSAAMQWSGIILFIPSVLRNVTLSYLAGTNNNVKQHDDIFKIMVYINFFSTLVPCMIIFSLSGFIVSFYGESFNKLSGILNVSVFGTIFLAIKDVYANKFISTNKIWTNFCLSSLFNVLILLFAYFLILKDIENGAYYLALSYIIINAFRLLAYHSVFKLNKNV